MSESKELVLVSLPSVPADLEAAFIDDKYINNLISEIREKTSTVVGDLNTVKGRSVYTSTAMNVRRTKTAIDEAGKNLVAEMKKRPDLVDASRRKVREALAELAIEIRKPAADLAAKIEADHELALFMDKDIDREREEARQKAEQAKREHEERIKREAEEKARCEADEAAKREIEAAAAREREATLAKERAEREAKELAEKAERDRIEAEQRAEREKKEAAERAEREKQEAIAEEQRKAHEAAEKIKRENEQKEQDRLAEEKRIADEAAQRTADKEHRREVNLAAVKGLVDSGISEQCARECIKAIAQGKVPNTAINY